MSPMSIRAGKRRGRTRTETGASSRMRENRRRVVQRSLFWLAIGVCSLWNAAGCGGGVSEPSSKPGSALKGAKIVVAAVDDAAILPTVTAQRGEWEASREASCTVAEKAVTSESLGNSHVLIFRGDRLGDLVDINALAVLPESLFQPRPASGGDTRSDADDGDPKADSSEGDVLQFGDVIPAFRNQVSKYGNDRVAIPYGGSALVLVTNRAAFDRVENKSAAKAAGIALEPPKTWTELDALATFFQGRDWNGDGTKDFGIAIPFAADSEGIGDAIYLARAASLAQHKDHYSLLFDSDTMEPRLTTPPFVEALRKIVDLKASGPPGAESFDPVKARDAFRKGDVAFLIDRAEEARRWGGGGVKVIVVSQLPGSERVYEPSRKLWEKPERLNRPSYLPFGGGWLAAVSASATGREREAAIDFIKYLVNPETSNRARSDRDFPMLPVRGAQVAQGLSDPRSAPGVEPRSWSEGVGKTLLASRVVPGLRIPRAAGYLTDLTKGRVAAAAGKPAEEALKSVADSWDARTKSLGIDRQLWHYRRSLNSMITAPKPPARAGGGGGG